MLSVKRMQIFRKISFISIALFCSSAAASGFSNTSEETYKLLFDLKPLPKVHYSWGLGGQLKGGDERILYELARITHSLSIAGEWGGEDKIEKCVYICARVNKSNPKIPCSIGVNYSPWHRKFGKDLPPTDRGATYYAELDYFNDRMRKVKGWVARANAKYKSDVKVGAVLLDSERFHVRANDKTWNEGIRQALDEIHIRAVSIFPKARIVWYGRGVAHIEGGNGWAKTNLFTGKEIKSSLSCSIYIVPEVERMQETYRRTAKLADEMGIENVMPWVALASGYKRGLKKTFYWESNWDYDLIYSYKIGAALNVSWYAARPERFAPYNRAKVIAFYPAPFDVRAPAWGKHFIAYVRGATGVKDLTDIGFDK